MKSIAIDFKNKIIGLMLDDQKGTEYVKTLDKSKFTDVFPSLEIMNSSSSFTWNFEDNIFAVNKEYDLHPDEIMTTDCFIPLRFFTVPGLNNKYNKMLELLGYEETEWTADDFKDFPEEIRKLFGF